MKRSLTNFTTVLRSKKKIVLVKLEGARKLWYQYLCTFLLVLPKFNFKNGDWKLGYFSTKI